MPHHQRGTKTPTHPVPSSSEGPSPLRAPHCPSSLHRFVAFPSSPPPKPAKKGSLWGHSGVTLGSLFSRQKHTPTPSTPATYTPKPPPKTAQTFIFPPHPANCQQKSAIAPPQPPPRAQDRTNPP